MSGEIIPSPCSLLLVQVECAHCQHQLTGGIRFLLDVVRCSNCGKYNKVESRAIATKLTLPPSRTAVEWGFTHVNESTAAIPISDEGAA